MRTLVYAASAYAVCMGVAEAFAPQFAVGGLASTRNQAGGLRMAWAAPAAGYDPKRRPSQAVSAPGYTAPSAPTPSYAAPDAPSVAGNSWKPPTGSPYRPEPLYHVFSADNACHFVSLHRSLATVCCPSPAEEHLCDLAVSISILLCSYLS